MSGRDYLTVLFNSISFYGVAFQLRVVSYDKVKILFIV